MGKIVREKYEWSNNWWDNADDPTLPRVLLIGDSISCGYSKVVAERLAKVARVDRVANSRGVHDPMLFKEVRAALEDYSYPVIHFNNGLHGMHLSDEEYGRGLRVYLGLLKGVNRNAQLVWASSTPVTQAKEGHPLDDAVNGQVVRRNAVAAAIMGETAIPVNDLYHLVLGRGELRVMDGYHYNEDGYRVLGDAVANVVLKQLKGAKA